MNGWFIAILLLYALNLGIATAKHGESRNEKYSFGTTLFGTIISAFLVYMAIKTGF